MQVNETIFVFVDCPFALCGIISQFINIFILNRLTSVSKIFSYLEFESVFILADCTTTLLLVLKKCEGCFPSLNPLALCVFDYIAYNFISDLFEYSSVTMEIMAALACFFMFDTTKNIRKPFDFLFKLPPSLLAFLVAAVSFIAAGYEVAIFKIEKDNSSSSNNVSKLVCADNEFQDSFAYIIVSSLSFGFYYGFMMLILVIINILIAVKVRKSLSSHTAAAAAMDKSSTAKRKSVERRLTHLVIFDCFNLILGRLPIIVYYFSVNLNVARLSYSSFTVLPILVSYNFKFFIFYKFNSRFRNEFKSIFPRLVSKLCCQTSKTSSITR